MTPYQQNQKRIGQGCLTNSKHENSFVKGVYPKTVKGGRCSTLIDSNGKEYIDFICGLGTNLFGYGNHFINSAIMNGIQSGISHSLPTHFEGIAAERLCELFPWVDKFKFLCTGSDACMASVRMARSYTKRLKVLVEGYHGIADMFVSLTPPAEGIAPHPDIRLLRDLNDIGKDIAAVIVEPVITDCSEERIKWLKDLREKCTENGVVLIFDEVITGFRYKNFSVARNYGVFPDLMCLGKAIGSGIPISAVAGRKDLLDGNYFISSTNAGSVAGLSAAIAAVDLLTGSSDYNINRLWESGQVFMNRFNKITPEIQIEGYPTRGAFKGDLLKRSLLFQECCKSGVLFGPSWFFNFSHVNDTDTVIDICSSSWARIERGEIELEGELPQSPYAERVRNG